MDKVRSWLISIGLPQYHNEFENDGWDDMDVVLDMGEDDIKKCGITKRGHIRKIKLAIDRLRQDNIKEVDDVCDSKSSKIKDIDDGTIVESTNPVDTDPGGFATEAPLRKQTVSVEATPSIDVKYKKTNDITLPERNDISTVQSEDQGDDSIPGFDDVEGRAVETVQRQTLADTSSLLCNTIEECVSTGEQIVSVRTEENYEHSEVRASDEQQKLDCGDEESCLMKVPVQDLSDTDDDYSQNALVHLSRGHAVVPERTPLVGHAVAIATATCVSKSTIVKDSRNVTVAEKVEIHNVQESQLPFENYAAQIRTALRSYKKKEHLFVKTRAYTAAVDILEDQNWVVISGNPGDGKSTIAHQLMLEHNRRDYHPVIVTSVDDWKTMVEGKSKQSNKQFVMIDDMFGSVSVDDRKLNEWMSLHDLIQDVIKERNGDLKVVCTTRKYILADIYEKVSRYKEFRKLSLVDLTESNNALTVYEKFQMIEVYASHYDISKDDMDVLAILGTDCPYGFPHCVEMFCTNALIRQQGASFFRRPLQLLQQEFLHFSKNEKSKYCALILLLFSPFNTFEVLEDIEDSQAMKHALKVAGLPTTTPVNDIMVSLESLNKVYVVELEIGVYTFKHESFKEILSVVVTKSHPRLSIQYMDVSVLVEYTKYEGYASKEDQLVAVLPKRCNIELIQSLTEAMLSGFCSIACQHQAWESTEFINQWLKYVTQKRHTVDERVRSNILTDLTANDGTLILHAQLSLIPSFIEAGHVQATQLVLNELERHGYFQSEINRLYISVVLAHSCSLKCPMQLIELLLQKGADIDVVISRRQRFTFGNNEHFTPLSLAIYNSNVELLKILLQNGASVFKQSEIGVNALYIAAKVDSVEAVTTILEHLRLQELGVTHKRCTQYEPQVSLYGENYRKYFSSLREVADFCAFNMFYRDRIAGSCAIHQTNNAVILDTLCNEGADVNEVASRQEFVGITRQWSHAAFRLNNRTLTTEILLKMIENKYNLNQTDSHGRNLLHELLYNLAIYQYSELLLELIDIVLKQGINVNAQDDEGSTPLHLFFGFENNNDVIEDFLDTLLFHKADVNITDKDGKTPLFLALQNDFPIEILSKLITLTRDVHDVEGQNSFHYLAMSWAYTNDGLHRIISLLQEKTVDINLLDDYGCAPILYASVDMMELFVSKGANANTLDNNGRTILMNAIRRGVDSIVQKVEYLLDIGADINAIDSRGRNVIHYIVESPYTVEVQLRLLQICLHKSCYSVPDFSGVSPVQLSFKLTRPDVDVIQYLFQNESLIVSGDKNGQTVVELVLRSSLEEENKVMIVNQFLPNEVDEALVLSASSTVCGIDSVAPIIGRFRFDDTVALKVMTVIMSSQRDSNSKCSIMDSVLEHLDRQRHQLLLQVDNSHAFLIKLLQAPACLKLFVQKGLIVPKLWPDGIDIALLPENDEEAIKVLDMMASCEIKIGLLVDASMQSTAAIELVEKGRLQLLAVLLNHCDKKLKWKADIEGNNVNHYLALSAIDDTKVAEVLERTLKATNADEMNNSLGQTPLMVACQQKHIHPKCIHTLALFCQDINTRDKHGQTALHYVVQHTENTDQKYGSDQLNAMLCYVLLDLLSQHARLDIQDEEGKTPLMYLLSGEHVYAFEEMVEICFSDVDSLLKADNYGHNTAYYLDISALNFLSKSQFTRKLHDRIVSSKEIVRSTDAQYTQPGRALYFASEVDKGIEVELLLEQHVAGWSADALIAEIKLRNIRVGTDTDITGISVLSKACQMFCSYEVVEAILNLGADPNKTELIGYTAVHRLILSLTLNSFCVYKCLAFREDAFQEMDFQVRNTPYVNIIRNGTLGYVQTLKKTIPIDRKGIHNTVLNCVNNGLRILHVLLKHGTDPNIVDVYGKTALHYCCESPLFDAFICPAMELLVAFGANVNSEDFEGRTPLMMCAQYGRTKFRRMNILIQAGANCLDVTDYDGNSIEHYVRKAVGKILITQL